MIIFENNSELDVAAILTMGASIKEEGAIGFFGTGLKYALAVLLRTNQRVTILSGMRRLEFKTQVQKIRGKEFKLITMNGEPMHITDELGKTWELWMAFRELFSNCLDEGGRAYYSEMPPQPEPDKTYVLVEGEAFESEFHQREQNFIIDRRPIFKTEEAEIYEGAGRFLFYRGVRVFTLGQPSVFTYNITRKTDLNEDRTLKYSWDADAPIVKALKKLPDRQKLEWIMTRGEHAYENHLNYAHGTEHSPEFEAALVSAFKRDSASLCDSLKKLAFGLSSDLIYHDLELSTLQRIKLERALVVCRRLGFDPSRYRLRVVETLGPVTKAQARLDTREIILAQEVFEGGTKFLAQVLLEETIHLRESLHDESRALQTYLFQKIVSLAEELMGEPI